MAGMTDLSARLSRLSSTVTAGIAQRQERERAEQVAGQARKAADWAAVQADHPDVAEHIKAMGAVFSKPAMVRVKDDAGTVLLDSRRYE